MNPTVDTRNTRLIGGIEIGGPLQGYWLGRSVFEAEHIIAKRSKAAGEIGRTGNGGEHFRRRAAERAVA